jgi:dihydroorotate dehydrogenase electron transfer subunit
MTSSASATRGLFVARTLERRDCGGEGHLLRVALPEPLPRPLEGGEFFELRTQDADFPFLNRPFSVHDARPNGRGPELAFLFKVVGRGTRRLARLAPGDPVTLVGPLGRPFPFEQDGATSILVAGGIGLPPLHLWLRRRLEEGRRDPALLLYGARVRAQLFELAATEALGVPVRTATEDGSHGLHGRVDALLARTLDELAGRPVRVLTCGPDPMMAAVTRLCVARKVPVLVSLETTMACGFGVCNACAVPVAAPDGTLARFARACIDGPVVDGACVLWQAAAH